MGNYTQPSQVFLGYRCPLCFGLCGESKSNPRRASCARCGVDWLLEEARDG